MHRLALRMLQEIIEQERSLEDQIREPDRKGGSQLVSFYAASHNLAGEIYLNKKDGKEAIFHFEEALKKQPDFALAQYNLTTTQEKLKTAKDEK